MTAEHAGLLLQPSADTRREHGQTCMTLLLLRCVKVEPEEVDAIGELSCCIGICRCGVLGLLGIAEICRPATEVREPLLQVCSLPHKVR